mmetsp:Transcript_9182/g.28147  ORF Transcript_9182/g.28147 Transcript_9182/m.28147 type:complete len:357 (-) Transcript_9182:914-1984(-)
MKEATCGGGNGGDRTLSPLSNNNKQQQYHTPRDDEREKHTRRSDAERQEERRREEGQEGEEGIFFFREGDLVVLAVGGSRAAGGEGVGAGGEDVGEDGGVAGGVGGLLEDLGDDFEALGAFFALGFGGVLVAEELGGGVAERGLDVEDGDAPGGLEDGGLHVGLLVAGDDGGEVGVREVGGFRGLAFDEGRALELVDDALDGFGGFGRAVRFERRPQGRLVLCPAEEDGREGVGELFVGLGRVGFALVEGEGPVLAVVVGDDGEAGLDEVGAVGGALRVRRVFGDGGSFGIFRSLGGLAGSGEGARGAGGDVEARRGLVLDVLQASGDRGDVAALVLVGGEGVDVGNDANQRGPER